jgi:hypothetical protein
MSLSYENVTALRSLLNSLIDYAGLFPPSALPMPKAVANYQAYRNSPEAWMLGRFVVPAGRLDEFEECVGDCAPISVSILSTGDLEDDLSHLKSARHPVDTIELKATDAGQIESSMREMPTDITAYFEINGIALLPVIRKAGARAKIRTGGITPEAFPNAETIARFLAACAAGETSFKATAGLHHPLRCFHSLTYSADGPSGWMFGFLNVFLGAVLARTGLPPEELVPLLLEDSVSRINFMDSGVTWHEWVFTAADIASARREFAISFGSCSFEEPVADLKELHLL